MDCLETQDFLMNTVVEQKIYSENPEKVYQKTVGEIKRLEKLMSFFIETSDVSIMNRSAGKEKVKIHADVMTILRKSLEISKISKGAFDITLAPVIDLWRSCGKISQLPLDDQIKERLYCTGYTHLKLDENTGTASLIKEGCAIDLGGIAKGFAADVCIDIYKSMGVESAFINFGGNVKTIGKKSDGQEWVIGIQHPDEKRGVSLGVVLVSDTSVVTSGIYERYFKLHGKKHHHILDARTGRPSESDIKSITIICGNSMQADALSTAVLVMGSHDGIELLHTIPEAEAVLVTRDNKIYLTKGVRQSFYLLEKAIGFDCHLI